MTDPNSMDMAKVEEAVERIYAAACMSCYMNGLPQDYDVHLVFTAKDKDSTYYVGGDLQHTIDKLTEIRDKQRADEQTAASVIEAAKGR